MKSDQAITCPTAHMRAFMCTFAYRWQVVQQPSDTSVSLHTQTPQTHTRAHRCQSSVLLARGSSARARHSLPVIPTAHTPAYYAYLLVSVKTEDGVDGVSILALLLCTLALVPGLETGAGVQLARTLLSLKLALVSRLAPGFPSAGAGRHADGDAGSAGCDRLQRQCSAMQCSAGSPEC